ncbi:MAG: class IV adenylate cyclase [Planctomycetaceae bacterium]|jgi:adenylate cyclase class 2|nr:class IV adenylate cyclase [Planctomycetaceae bacterium]
MNLFEVEIKFQVEDTAELERQLRDFGFPEFGRQVKETDTFFRHPVRDFAETDECLRLRKRKYADRKPEFYLTYKGPKIDTETKTRQEIEMPVEDPQTLESILTVLGFIPAAKIAKFRRRAATTVEGRLIEAVLDELPDLPLEKQFFIELETLAGEHEVAMCRQLLRNIAAELGLKESIRTSYLRLIQEVRADVLT